MEQIPEELTAFLTWLTAGGAVVLVSWICEQIPAFHNLSAGVKRLITWGAAVVLGMGALAVQLYAPPELLEQIAPFFAIFASTFAMVFLSKAWHSLTKTQ